MFKNIDQYLDGRSVTVRSESNKCPRLHERNIIVPVDKKIDPVIVFCYCIFVILLQIIGNDVISDAINMITLNTIRNHYDT